MIVWKAPIIKAPLMNWFLHNTFFMDLTVCAKARNCYNKDYKLKWPRWRSSAISVDSTCNPCIPITGQEIFHFIEIHVTPYYCGQRKKITEHEGIHWWNWIKAADYNSLILTWAWSGFHSHWRIIQRDVQTGSRASHRYLRYLILRSNRFTAELYHEKKIKKQ